MKTEKYYQFLPDELNALAKSEIERLGLESIGFTFYWTCCLTSDVNLDYEASFAKTIVPSWWTPEFNRSFSAYGSPGQPILPPKLTNERDRHFFLRQWGMDSFSDGRGWVFLSSSHQLNAVLSELHGPARKKGRVGQKPIYSDRLAVRCAALRKFQNSALQISKLVDFPEDVVLKGNGPEVVRYLIIRGNRLIEEYELKSNFRGGS